MFHTSKKKDIVSEIEDIFGIIEYMSDKKRVMSYDSSSVGNVGSGLKVLSFVNHFNYTTTM